MRSSGPSPWSHKLVSLPAPATILQDGAVSLQHGPPHNEGVPFNPAAPAPPQPGFIPQYQAGDQASYPSMPAQSPILSPSGMPPQIPLYTPMEMPSQMSPQMSPQFPPHMPPHISHQIPGVESRPTPPSPQQLHQPSPPSRGPPPQMDFYDNMAQMVRFFFYLFIIFLIYINTQQKISIDVVFFFF